MEFGARWDWGRTGRALYIMLTIGRALYTMLMILVTVLGTIGKQLNEKGTEIPCPPHPKEREVMSNAKKNRQKIIFMTFWLFRDFLKGNCDYILFHLEG